ncbi:MAG: AAA family ATPase [Acidobacteria bacterium]|nr:AAA family ATPase [Acidobacteriota bacterium]
MYETYYGFAEKPFSLTPDPKYLYRSESHGNAFDLLQYAIRRREGFVVVTGDIGTGKTTLCRALLEQIDRTTFTALVLNPFLSEEDLLKRILLDFGVISRDEMKAGALAGVSKQELIDVLYDFLLGLIPLKASAVLIIDEAQNLPLQVLEQIRILSNLETDKEKLLQIILVGQLNLKTLLRSAELRQLDQRVSIRYELEPLDAETVARYIAHRLTIAGGSSAVTFAPKAVARVHRLSGGIPRLINLLCDRALLSAYSVRATRVAPEMVQHAAESLDLQPPSPRPIAWVKRRAALLTAAAVVLAASISGAAATAWLYQRYAASAAELRIAPPPAPPLAHPDAAALPSSHLPAMPAGGAPSLPPGAALTILVGSYPVAAPESHDQVRLLTQWLEASGFAPYVAEVDLGADGRWQRVLAGAYTDPDAASRDAQRLRGASPSSEARVLTAADATGAAAAPARAAAEAARRSGI